MNALGDLRKQDKEDIILRKGPRVDIDQELSMISQEMSFIDPEQKRDNNTLTELKPDGKFKIPNKELSLEEKKERYDPIVYVIKMALLFSKENNRKSMRIMILLVSYVLMEKHILEMKSFFVICVTLRSINPAMEVSC